MTTRREFLGLAATAIGTSAACAGPIEPFKRTGRPVLKLSLAAYSMRQFLDAKPNAERRMNFFQFLDYAATLGLLGVEPTSYYLPKDPDAEYINKSKLHSHMR